MHVHVCSHARLQNAWPQICMGTDVHVAFKPMCICTDLLYVYMHIYMYNSMRMYMYHVCPLVSVPMWLCAVCMLVCIHASVQMCTCKYLCIRTCLSAASMLMQVRDILHVCVQVCCYKKMDACRHECVPVHRQVCTPACWSADVQKCRYVCKHLYMFAILLVCM